VPGHGTPAARGSKEEHDTTCNRRPARYDPKELLFNMTERSKPDMQWSERYGYDQHPEEYSGKNKGYSNIFLTNTCQISWGHRELLADAEYERQNTPSCRRFPSVVEAKKRQTPDSPPKIRFAPDSPPEQAGFEPSAYCLESSVSRAVRAGAATRPAGAVPDPSPHSQK
jgi:hypothetical protein